MYLKKIVFRVPFYRQLLWLYEAFARGAIRDGSLGLSYVHLRVELFRIIELKVKEIKLTGRMPEISSAPHGDLDPRVLNSSLQKSISDAKKVEIS